MIQEHATGEISYDLAMDENMSFAEGVFRLPNQEWRVWIVSALQRNVDQLQVSQQTWDNGQTGLVIHFARGVPINAANIEQVLSEEFAVSGWLPVHGPDSMELR